MFNTEPGNKELMIETTRYMGFFKAEEGRGHNIAGRYRDAENSLNTAGVCAAIAAKLRAQPPNVVDLEAWELGIVIANLRAYGEGRKALTAEQRAALQMDATAWGEFSAQVCETLATMLDARLSKVH